MKLSDELRGYSCHFYLKGEDHIAEAMQFDRWRRLAAELEAQIAELEAEVKHLHEMHDFNEKQNIELEAELAHANIESVDLENENQRLRDALEWYRDNDVISGVAHKALEKEV